MLESSGQLNKAMKDLMQRWHEASSAWRDARSQEFEKKYLQPLEADLRHTLGAMNQMAQLLHQIRRDCSD